ncbi:hypothetical protein W59_27126 [Rhodococcus opacus RKJ300 = JCM 13270]|uniref:Uncharacterized protein n=1 Tax=Rhodococcus opacus RKJ300 = JCM 13270 TaxID=1165867 RepID=I0WIJ4_RHOOP|nr:hypothetical protein W59_27126 [Rhodococcus opacus RKJ300 = JCM 13270]
MNRVRIQGCQCGRPTNSDFGGQPTLHYWLIGTATATYFLLTVAAQCPHRELLAAGNPELAYDEGIEGCTQGSRHLPRDGYTSAREAEDDDAWVSPVRLEQLAQNASSFSPVSKDVFRSDCRCVSGIFHRALLPS